MQPPAEGQPITGPFIVPPTTDIPARMRWLDQIVRESARDPAMIAARDQVMVEAQRMAKRTPSYRGDWFARIVALEAIRRVHEVPYVAGPEGLDEFAPASYTLQHGGDCDRLGTLLAGLCCLCGLISRVNWLEQPGQALDHVSVEIMLDGRWLWAEPSVPGAVLGEDPYAAVRRLGAWHVVGSKAKAAEGAGAAFAWDGWQELWNGWPIAWFQQNYPYIFRGKPR